MVSQKDQSRARASRDAPVDYLGCHTLGEHANGEEVFRFQTLVALVLSSRTSDGATATAMQRLRVLTKPFGGLTAAGLSKVPARTFGSERSRSCARRPPGA